jgi:antitoxin component of RelBE/YafQ-DinJ toxin-antitoxin module
MNKNKSFKMIKDTAINIRVNSFIKDEFKTLLAEQGLSITQFIEEVMIRELKKEGRTVTVKIEEKIV